MLLTLSPLNPNTRGTYEDEYREGGLYDQQRGSHQTRLLPGISINILPFPIRAISLYWIWDAPWVMPCPCGGKTIRRPACMVVMWHPPLFAEPMSNSDSWPISLWVALKSLILPTISFIAPMCSNILNNTSRLPLI